MNNYECVTLNNGLKVYMYQDENKHSINVSLCVKFGGKYNHFMFDGKEYRIVDGIAHFIEHVLIERTMYGNLIKLFGEKNMLRNAYTSGYMTRYFFETSKSDDLEYGLIHLINGINKHAFTHEDIEKTKSAVLQEIRMRLDSPERQISNTSNKNSFVNMHFINNLGTYEEIESITYDDVKLCLDAFYHPKNEFILITGNFDKNQVIKYLEELYKDIKFENHKVELIDEKEPANVLKEYEEVKMRSGTDLIGISYKIYIGDFNEKERLKFDHYLNFYFKMNFGIDSNLYSELMKSKLISKQIGFGYGYFDDYVLCDLRINTNVEIEVIKRIEKVINEKAINKELFELYIISAKMHFSTISDSINSLVENICENILFNFEKIEDIDFINSLNIKEFKEFINKLNFKNHTIIKITNI